MVRPEGLEPPTNGLGNRCSILLSYGRIRLFLHLGPRNLAAPSKTAWASFKHKNGAPGRIRTCDHRIRSPLLYPAELRAHPLVCYLNGGERGIRTLDTGFSPYNRLAGDRLRPTRPSLREGVLWRRRWDSNPRNPQGFNGFQDRLLKPLGHPSKRLNLLPVKALAVYHSFLFIVNVHT